MDRVLGRDRCLTRLVAVVSAPSAVAVLLINGQGDVLLQLRDEHARVGPSLWCTVGGAVEPGEPPVDAAVRELAEETGLRDQLLELWWAGNLPRNAGPGVTAWHVYVGTTSASTENITVGEGADIRFVPRADVLDRPLVPSARVLLTCFLGGDQGATIG